MKRHVLGVLALSLLMGCSFRGPAVPPTEVPRPTVLTEVSTWVPVSIPVVPALDPNDAGGLYAAPASDMRLISSREEMTAFIDKFPNTVSSTPIVPHGQPVPSPVTQPVVWPESVTGFDFDKYQAVAFTLVGTNTATARIVGVEEQPNRLVVHTVQWTKTTPHHQNSFLHIVGVPRTTKPIVFAATLQKALVSQTQQVYPSPQVGVPDTRPIAETNIGELPSWKLIPNPELTTDKVESLVRTRFKTSEISNVTVEKQTLQWVWDNLGEGLPDPLLRESEVWIVHMNGELNTENLPGGAEARFSKIRMVLTSDTGYLLSLVGTP